ncbi:MAG: dTDP-glucose 4,6-dehydratase [Thaumarchaeota archaeon]|jgi:dTDP-glucose 4,6-dehydratase|nr:MAG: dTDP-glucose 4,6-dehydratase [Nitrososphaerota archaeon]
MKLLVTGGSGFIGSNFIQMCLNSSKKNSVINLDAMFVGSNPKNLQNIRSRNYKFVKGNICDSALIKKLINKVDCVVNFAAESHVDRSIDDSTTFLKSNVLGVHTILEEVRKNKQVKMLQISTDEVFGDIVKGSFFENDQLSPSNPYAATKAAAEMLVKSYVRTYDLDVTITRCANNYGPHQFPEKLIPKVILFALHDLPIPIHGDGKAIRQWIHVSDHCRAILKILQKNTSHSVYNIPGNYECNNLALVKNILKIMKKSEDLIEFVPDRLGQDKRYAIKSKFLSKDVGFKPKIKFDSGLSSTISWYLNNKNWWKNYSLKNKFSGL